MEARWKCSGTFPLRWRTEVVDAVGPNAQPVPAEGRGIRSPTPGAPAPSTGVEDRRREPLEPPWSADRLGGSRAGPVPPSPDRIGGRSRLLQRIQPGSSVGEGSVPRPYATRTLVALATAGSVGHYALRLDRPKRAA